MRRNLSAITLSTRTLVLAAFGLCLAAPLYAHHVQKGASTNLPVTTTSAKARELYQKGMVDYENLYLERCNDEWRAAVMDDPNLAVAWAWIAFNSGNPQEVSKARARAKEAAPKATPGEQLMVAWIAKVQEGDFLGGITAMNDMLEMYPHDKHLLYLAGNWLMGENGNDQAQRLFEKALAIDKNFPAALNDLAYVQARNRQFDKALPAMERYIALLPKEPNPQDSYGELLRMAGNFQGSLQHYRAALKIDPAYAQASADFAEAKLDGLGTEADRLALRTNAYNLGSSPGAVPRNAARYSPRRRRRNWSSEPDQGVRPGADGKAARVSSIFKGLAEDLAIAQRADPRRINATSSALWTPRRCGTGRGSVLAARALSGREVLEAGCPPAAAPGRPRLPMDHPVPAPCR